MLDAFGAALPIAVGVAVSPFPIVAAVLVLLSPAGSASGLAFLAARVASVAFIAGLFAAISDLIVRSDEVAPWVAVTRILVGIGLMVLAVGKWPRRQTEQAADLPAWMRAIEDASPARAARIAVILSVANPKELLLGVGAGITIGSAGLPLGATLAVAAGYTALACATVAAPVIAFTAAPDRFRGRLEQLRELLLRHNAAIMSVVLLVIGAVLIGGGLSDL